MGEFWRDDIDEDGNEIPKTEQRSAFKKLEGKLAKKKGVSDPGALAAYIGTEKYGKAGMAAKAKAGKAKAK